MASPPRLPAAPRSTIAAIQQAWVVVLGLAALCVAWKLAPSRPLLALVVPLGLLASHAWVLAIEFLLLFAVRDAAPGVAGPPRPGARALAAAWRAETCHAWRVFAWRQPFRWRTWPDRLDGEGVAGRRGVLLVHGFVCNRGFWAPWLRRLSADRRAFSAVNLEPPFASIDDYVEALDEAARRLQQATGLPALVVCHSMGGLAVRAWLARRAAEGEAMHGRVERVVTIGSPHAGTWLARFSHTRNGREMRPGSAWLERLAQAWRSGEAGLAPGRFTCWYSNADNIVMPASSAMLAGADNRLVNGAGHVDLAFREEVIEGTLAILAQEA